MYHKFHTRLAVITLFSLVLLYVVTPINSFVFASELTIKTDSDWQSGTLNSVENTSTNSEIKLIPQGNWGAQSWKTPDKTIGIGSTFTSDGEKIYVFRGNGDVAFWRYTPTTDSWETLANSPRGVYYGADLAYHGGYIYALFGGYQKAFARYSIANNTWELVTDFPSFVWQGGSLTSDGNYLYGTPGNTTQEFYRFNPTTNTWSALTQAPNTLRSGADLVYINGYIYTPRGNNTITFYRYNIAKNIWESLANLPTAFNDEIDATTDGLDLYVSRQQASNIFYRYNVASDTWDNLSNSPYTAQYAGVQYLSSDGLIYFFRGSNDYRFWKYDPNQAVVSGTTLQSDGKIVIGGRFSEYNGTSISNIARLNSNGTLDNSFDPGLGTNGPVSNIVVQNDGKILIAGNFSSVNGITRNRIARLNSDGSLDNTFNSNLGPDGYIQSMAIQSDGKIVIGGSFTNFNGSDRNRIARLNSDGSLDNAFDPGLGANDVVNAVAVQTDGKIIIGGAFTTVAGNARNMIARLNPNGSIESTTTFNPGVGANDKVHSVAIQSDGKIIIGGAFTNYAGNTRNRVARLNTNGTHDSSFNPGTGANDVVNAVTIQNDGRIIIRGYFASFNGTTRNRIARLLTTGALDTGFDPGIGVNNTIHSLATQNDGSVIVGGSFTSISGVSHNRIGRLTSTGSLDSSFNPGSGADMTNGTTKDKFIGPSEAPLSLGQGSDAVFYNGDLYVLRGNNTNTFYRYTPNTNTWTVLANAPAAFNDDTHGTVAGGLIYFLRGGNTNAFYSYDPVSNTWNTSLPVTPATVNYGGALYYPGSGGYIYATRGGNTNTFWRYTIGGIWEQSVGGLPIPNLPNEVMIGYGSRLVGSGDEIYLNSGSGTKRLFKYSVSQNTWTEQSSLPFSPLWGTDLEFANGVITAIAGNYEKDVYEFNPVLNSWRKLNSLPGFGPNDFGPYSGAVIVHEPNTNSYYITRGGNRTEVLVYSPGLSSFPASGSWTSGTLDLQYVSSWTSLITEAFKPSDSQVIISTRTSADGNNWSNWQDVSENTINSPNNRYLQLRASLYASSDLSQSPALKKIVVDYTSELTPPENPSSFQGFSSQVGGEQLLNEQSYKHTSPYFTWAAGNDNQSVVTGYFVYFGPEENGNPITQGNFQTNTNYQSHLALETGPYYLRVATKNSVDLISEPITGFIYDYNGVSPYSTLTQTSTADFSGSTNRVFVGNDSIQLNKLSSGFWQSERLALVNTTIQWGGSTAAYVASQNKIYVSPGAGNTLFRAYNLNTNAWENLTDTPAAVGYGGGVVEGPPGYLYVLRGGLFTDFWMYDYEGEGAGTWNTSITAAPLTIGYGASMVYDGSQYIYVTRGNNTNTFWRYDTTNDMWTILAGVEFGAPTNAITNSIHRSADLTIDRSSGLIYATQGNYYQGFSVYNINTGQWSILPSTPTLTYDGSSLEFDPATNRVFYTAGNTTDYFYAYNVSNQEWQKLNSTPATMQYGAGLVKANSQLYLFRGGNTANFYKYDIAKNSWLIPNRGLFSRVFDGAVGPQGVVNTGADIVKGDGNNFYLTRGNYADDFLRWNEKTGEVTQLANTPNGVYTGSSLVYDNTNNQIYFTAGTNDRSFFSYNIDNNTWTKISTDPIPAVTNVGSSMVYDGNRYIYLSQGNSNIFRRYDQQATAGSRWTTLPVIPATIGNGAELLLKDGYIYTMRGGNNANNPLYRYTIGGGWQTLTSLTSPLNTTVHNDGFLVDGNDGYLYLSRGLNSSDFYRYSLTNNSWEASSTMPAQVTTGGAAESNLLNKIYMLTGAGTDTYSDALYTYVLNTANSSFEDVGSYTSPSHDLTSVYRWANLKVTQETPENTELVITTRTSNDSANWTEWVNTSQPKVLGNTYQYKINSPVARYIQIQFDFYSSDKVFTPTIYDYTINYYQDTLPPSNPATEGFVAYSDASKSATLSNLPNVWHNTTAPLFEWAETNLAYGATDTATGSGVLGYYVYFGTDETANPKETGSFQSQNSYTPSYLVNNSLHYLRVQTVDQAGNVNPEVWQPFIYRFDAEGPTAPSNLVANPSGYSSNPNFSFSWEAASTSGALISSYCYKTATDSGVFATDQCTTNLNVDNIPSYKVGINTFSVRTKDQAGNYSSYANVSYFYADVANAPAPPTNLQVNPASNTENSFAFSWSPPEAFLGSASNLSYRYSINALPTNRSTSETSLTYLNAGAFATLPGENTFYVVAKDEAGNINYNNYASITFNANTVAPGIPINMEIADVSVKSKKSWRLAISWDEPENLGSGVASYKVYRSLDGINFSQLATTSGTSYVDTKLDQVIYYYRITACDNTNNCGAESTIVSLLPTGKYTEPAELVSGPTVSTITTKKVTISWSTARTADSRVAYGTSSGNYFETEISSSEQVANHVLNIPNLTPGTTYYYVARWTDEDGNTGQSEEKSFSTQPPPSTQEPKVKSLGLTTALIEFTTKNAKKVKLYYGESPSYGGVKELSTGTAEGTYTIQLEELKDGTKYYYKINTFDVDDAEYEGEMHSFTTLPRPNVSNISITEVQGAAQTTLLIRWKSNTPISSIVTYFPTASPQKAKDEVNIALKEGDHRMILLNLEPQTPYSIIIKGRDAAGNEARSEVQQVVTSADTRPPQIIDLKIESEIIGVGEEATAQLLVSYKTDEAATSQIEYGEGTGSTYSQKTQEDPTLVSQHLVVISGLNPGKVYHLRALAKDENNNQGVSIDKVIVTPKATESALDLVISNLTSVFSFLQSSK